MITSPAFSGKRYAVLGLARSGLATVEALLASGADVTAWDGNEAARQSLHPGEGRGPETTGDMGPGLRRGRLEFGDPLEIDLAGFAAVVVSPGVPLNRHPIAAKARAADVPVIGDIELFAQARAALPPHKVVGITGTNGKSTTTALIHHILESAGVPTLMGGNIGLPILSRDPLPAGGVYVFELSSYQIDLTFSLDCDVAVLINITPDHLDRYDGFEGYAASKERLFAMSTGTIVIATEDEPSNEIAARHPAGLVSVTSGDIADQSRWPSLQGPHNAQNAACAIAVAKTLGLADDAIERGLATYPGLPHRMERVAEIDDVLFINDSKATNATATAPALAAYPLIHWILGGIAKTDDLDDCAPGFDHVVRAYTIGEAGPMFARILDEAGVSVTQSGTLDQAVRDAATAAKPGEVVMLSPACASFDQFKDYEARGAAFRAFVGAFVMASRADDAEDEGGGGAALPPVPPRKRQGDRFGRGDRSPVAVWFWEIDRVLLCLVTVLIGIGLIAVAAAAPAAAHRYSDAGHAFPRLYYFWRQLIWTALSVPVLIAVSMLPKDTARRLALFGAVAFTLLLMMVPVLGGEAKNGAQRWVGLGPIQVQPAEFLKPFFVIAVAWLLSLRATDGKAHREGDSKLPTPLLSGLYLGVVAVFLMKQPDFGQTVIFAFVWAVLLMISGVQMKWLAALGGAAVAGIGLAYEFYPVAHERIGRFLNSDDPSNREIGGQVESALRTLTHGGFLGTGPGGGTMKMNLPEPHTDYIFSVIGEEFGLVACLAIALIYLTIVVRVLLKLLHEEDRFLMLASAGLVTQFGLQAMINMAVNVHLAPSKGMTLPFISYGGSSMIALSMGFGLLLAFTRKNPYLTRSPYVVSWKAK